MEHESVCGTGCATSASAALPAHPATDAEKKVLEQSDVWRKCLEHLTHSGRHVGEHMASIFEKHLELSAVIKFIYIFVFVFEDRTVPRRRRLSRRVFNSLVNDHKK